MLYLKIINIFLQTYSKLFKELKSKKHNILTVLTRHLMRLACKNFNDIFDFLGQFSYKMHDRF